MTPLIRLTVAWVCGIILMRWFSPPPFLLFLLTVLTLVALILYRNEYRPRWLALSVLGAILGATRLLLATPAIDSTHVAFYNDTDPITLTARIIDEPDIRDSYTNLRVKAETVQLANGEMRAVDGLVLVRAGRYPQYHYGDTLSIDAGLETPPVFEGFSYRDFLARQNIHAIMRRPRITLLKEQSGFSIRGAIFAFKAKAHQAINQILPEPHAALLNGILLGIESGIPKDLYEEFNRTGASHVIVISGSNISLVVAILLLAGQKVIGKRYATILAIIGVILYTIMVGADSSVIRAAIMGVIFVLAMAQGRTNNVLNTLFAAALFMTLHNPLTLWDVGFQLSFMATLGLIVLVPPLERGMEKLLGGLFQSGRLQSVADLLNEALLVTIAAQIITTPLILYQFGRFSIVSLLTNLLIVPVQPFVMIFGGLATMSGLIFLPLGRVLGWLAWLPLAWTIDIVRWTASFSWAQVELPAFPFWLMVLSYLCIGTAAWWLHQPDTDRPKVFRENNLNRTPVFMAGGLLVAAILVWSATRNLPDGRLHVAFLDIGQGDAILLTTPNGRQILVDGGPSAAQLGQRLGEEMPFWDRSIDMVVNTHPDLDHLAGLVELVGRYELETVLISDAEGRSALYWEWVDQLQTAVIPTTQAWNGMTLQLDEGVEAVVLNPGPASNIVESPNDHSVVLKVVMGEVSFLLTGDIETDVERVLAADGTDLRATVLKSAHHGSRTSSIPAFLAQVNPQIVVISAGLDNRFGHPHEEILQRYEDLGATIFRTDQQGTVELVTDGEQIWVETQK